MLRELPPQCQQCGYELTGLAVGGACPECGRKIRLLIPKRLGERLARCSFYLGIAALFCYPAGCASARHFGLGVFFLGQGCAALGIVCAMLAKHRTIRTMSEPKHGVARTGFWICALCLIPLAVFFGVVIGGMLLGHQQI